MFDEEQIFDFEEADIEDESTPQSENNFVDTINKSIRKAFIKMGVVSGTVIIAIVMLIVFVVPLTPWVDFVLPVNVILVLRDGTSAAVF